MGENLQPSHNIITFIINHAERIYATVSYAVSQRNNHITSEAVALYMAGGWISRLNNVSENQREMAITWFSLGKKLLENNVAKLVMHDGTFSQYSINYHRLLIDTISIAIIWQRRYKLMGFSSLFFNKYVKALEWLANFVDERSGNVPNIGHNDGSLLYSISNTDYRDFRSSIQLATVILTDSKYYESGVYDDILFWLMQADTTFLKEPKIRNITIQQIKNYSDGGFLLLQRNNIRMFFRYPNFQFRPAQADCLHIDLWVNGKNILIDSGSYCYNQHVYAKREYFFGIASHNTIQVDNRQPMPRLSTFLFGQWIRSKVEILNNDNTVVSSYKDYKGTKHERSITFESNKIVILDNVFEYENCAILRWNLAELEGYIEDNKYITDKFQIEIYLNNEIAKIQQIDTDYSLYYLNCRKRTTLEVIAQKPLAEFRTIFIYKE
jgi:hypothetical protein